MDDLREPFKEMAYENIAKCQLWVDRIYREEERSTTTRSGENARIPTCVQGARSQFELLCDAVYHHVCAEIAKEQDSERIKTAMQCWWGDGNALSPVLIAFNSTMNNLCYPDDDDDDDDGWAPFATEVDTIRKGLKEHGLYHIVDTSGN